VDGEKFQPLRHGTEDYFGAWCFQIVSPLSTTTRATGLAITASPASTAGTSWTIPFTKEFRFDGAMALNNAGQPGG
jgi:hypothetical protein